MSTSYPPNPIPGLATNIVVSPASSALAAGDTLQLSAALTDTNGNPVSVTETIDWQSSNTDLVTVDDSGLCTASSVSDGDFSSGGQVTVTASYPWASAPDSGATISAVCVVTVTVAPAVPTDLFVTQDSYGPGVPTSGSWIRTPKVYPA
jgi:uncharacterized protein YjdB